MATKLKDIKVNEVSLVDRPANKSSKVVLAKRVDDSESSRWYAEFEQSLAKRERKSEMGSYSWNTPQAPADPGSVQSGIAHEHIKRIADEVYRLRAKLSKAETGTTEMTYEDMIQKAGATAEEIIQLRADALRKREPHLTPEQAFSKIYCDPANMHLRRAEREKMGS